MTHWPADSSLHPSSGSLPLDRIITTSSLPTNSDGERTERKVPDWLPLTNVIEIVRPLFMDQWPAHPLRHALVLLAYTVVAFWVALALTRRRFSA